MTKIIDGTRLARSFREDTSQAAGALAAQGCPPKLAVVVATEDESTGWYVRSIAQAARQIGITCDIVDVGPTASTEEIRSPQRIRITVISRKAGLFHRSRLAVSSSWAMTCSLSARGGR